jgi:hypothetical protein
MHAEPDRDFFLLAGIEWAGYAAGGAACRPVAAVVYREAACCHLLFRAGKYAAVLARLRAVRARVFGAHPPDGPQPGANPDAAQTLAVAADLFHRLRLALAATGNAPPHPGGRGVRSGGSGGAATNHSPLKKGKTQTSATESRASGRRGGAEPKGTGGGR